MKKELDEALVRDFPNLFQDRNAPMGQTCMCWGFECGDGWEPLIRRLCEKLEPLEVVAMQVKEKFGGLRFYTTGDVNDKVWEMTQEAETESYKSCEMCGKLGKLLTIKGHPLGWRKTLCPSHADQLGYREIEES